MKTFVSSTATWTCAATLCSTISFCALRLLLLHASTLHQKASSRLKLRPLLNLHRKEPATIWFQAVFILENSIPFHRALSFTSSFLWFLVLISTSRLPAATAMKMPAETASLSSLRLIWKCLSQTAKRF